MAYREHLRHLSTTRSPEDSLVIYPASHIFNQPATMFATPPTAPHLMNADMDDDSPAHPHSTPPSSPPGPISSPTLSKQANLPHAPSLPSSRTPDAIILHNEIAGVTTSHEMRGNVPTLFEPSSGSGINFKLFELADQFAGARGRDRVMVARGGLKEFVVDGNGVCGLMGRLVGPLGS
ncbi:hypothetical protein EK21DRAFT_95693 [Setomelanomma holmii]|uniref:Uncharacterized protein n=1 Tax=Setomelanomma holmii TaxID=210430 RepID=A0A9P4GVW1_9PLEO|nr:hypothetical protein EK21DRAFT_95693 [Setomelanomma holmii]